jgi:hypothetical protein
MQTHNPLIMVGTKIIQTFIFLLVAFVSLSGMFAIGYKMFDRWTFRTNDILMLVFLIITLAMAVLVIILNTKSLRRAKVYQNKGRISTTKSVVQSIFLLIAVATFIGSYKFQSTKSINVALDCASTVWVHLRNYSHIINELDIIFVSIPLLFMSIVVAQKNSNTFKTELRAMEYNNNKVDKLGIYSQICLGMLIALLSLLYIIFKAVSVYEFIKDLRDIPLESRDQVVIKNSTFSFVIHFIYALSIILIGVWITSDGAKRREALTK